MPITFVQFLELFDPYLILFGRRLILFHQTHEHAKHQSAENLQFIFCRNLYFYCIFQSLCKSKLLCGRETYITHFNI